MAEFIYLNVEGDKGVQCRPGHCVLVDTKQHHTQQDNGEVTALRTQLKPRREGQRPPCYLTRVFFFCSKRSKKL